MKAPFPYFGGKLRVADIVWDALGDCRHYIEPFFGSGAVLLNRPTEHVNTLETVCAADGFVANVWRAIKFAPDEVAQWCDWPVNHADLSARKRRLLANEARLLENLIDDDEWFDAKLAGYWVWAASCWIGSGLTSPGARPHVSHGGVGVHAIGQRPHVGDSGSGVHAIGQIPHVSTGGKGDVHNPNIYAWMRALADRLRYVRVVCGDWTRVCGGRWQDKIGVCGMFFDPPYSGEHRDTDLYHKESVTVAHDVRQWALERGSEPSYRIVIAGYDEHEQELTAAGWAVRSWKAQGGYSNVAGKGGASRGANNRHREKLYFSPHCVVAEAEVSPAQPQRNMLFRIAAG